jgi:toxin ParE1/3/4
LSPNKLRRVAEKDLEDIWFYSFEMWGVEQADSYIRSLIARFEWLAINQLSGRKRDDIKSGYYCFPEGEHVIFYKTRNGIVDIIGVPHHSQNVAPLGE